MRKTLLVALLAAILPWALPVSAKTIYLVSDGIESHTPHVYEWDGGGNTGWPGKAMTAFKQENGKTTVWKHDFEKSDNFIINLGNGNPQSCDLKVNDYADGQYVKFVYPSNNNNQSPQKIADPSVSGWFVCSEKYGWESSAMQFDQYDEALGAWRLDNVEIGGRTDTGGGIIIHTTADNKWWAANGTHVSNTGDVQNHMIATNKFVALTTISNRRTVVEKAGTYTIYAKMEGGVMNIMVVQEGGTLYDNVYMPLTPADFKGGKKQYFFVGTRTADWSLQPEWQLAVDGNTARLDGRLYYTGMAGIAVVDSYDDYVRHRYTLYTTGSTYGCHRSWTGTPSNPIAIKNCGSFMARNTPETEYADRNRNNTLVINTQTNNGDDAMTDTHVLESAPWQGDLVVNLEAGVPKSMYIANWQAAGYGDRVFTLVGSNIYKQGDEKAVNTRAMAAGDYTGKGWQDGWVQYDNAGQVYVDYYGQPLYHTVFQKSYLDAHPAQFNIVAGDRTRDFSYNSQQITFVEATQSDGYATDPYRQLYDRFEGGSDNRIGADGIRHVTANGLDYYEKTVNPGGKAGARTSSGWQCFVVKDMWIEGQFKIWSGWGGNTKRREGQTNPKDDEGWRQSARWYYQNGGHGIENQKYDVQGGDCAAATSEDRAVTVYGTKRDVNGADFAVPQRTYFKRVILWYDPAQGFENSVIQLVTEHYGPNIAAFRTDKNHLDYEWTIPAENGSGTGPDARLASYTVTRYYLDDPDDNGTVVEENTPLDGIEVAALGKRTFNDPSALAAGTYRYQVTVLFADGTRRSAMSNQVTVYAESAPAIAVAAQRTENAGGTLLYSFDLGLTLKTSDRFRAATAMIDGTEVQLSSLVGNWLVVTDQTTAQALNAVSDIKFTAADGIKVYDGGQEKSIDGYALKLAYDNEKDIELLFENVDPSLEYNFNVYMQSDAQAQQFMDRCLALNYIGTNASAKMTVPGAEVTLGTVRTTSGIILGDARTPVGAMPIGAYTVDADGNRNPVAPIHYTKANALMLDVQTPALPVTRSVTDNWQIVKRLDAQNAASETIEIDGAEASAGTFTALDLGTGNLTTLADGTTVQTVSAGARTVTATVTAAYARGPINVTSAPSTPAKARIEMPDLAAPQVNIAKVTVANSAQNGVVYLDVLLHASVDVATDLTAAIGYHVAADVLDCHDHIFHPKAANGGAIIDNATGYKDDIEKLDGYTHLADINNGWAVDHAAYDQDTHNWAEKVLAQKMLPVHVNHIGHVSTTKLADAVKAAGDAFANDGNGLYVYAYYPFVSDSRRGGYTSAAPSAHAGQAELAPVVAATVAADNGVALKPDFSNAGVTGAADIAADVNVTGAWYNLQGLRVDGDRLTPGLYLRRSAGQTVKILVK